jgi:hypothetical protein
MCSGGEGVPVASVIHQESDYRKTPQTFGHVAFSDKESAARTALMPGNSIYIYMDTVYEET